LYLKLEDCGPAVSVGRLSLVVTNSEFGSSQDIPVDPKLMPQFTLAWKHSVMIIRERMITLLRSPIKSRNRARLH